MMYSNYSNFVRHFRNGVLYLGKRCTVLCNVHYSAAGVGQPSHRVAAWAKNRKVGNRVKTHRLWNMCKQFFSGFFLFTEKLLKEPDVLYMKNKYQHPIALTLSILCRVFQKGNAKHYAVIRQQTAQESRNRHRFPEFLYKQLIRKNLYVLYLILLAEPSSILNIH